MQEYRTGEVAKMLDIPVRTVKSWCRKGLLPFRRSKLGSGRYYLVPRDELIRFARANGLRIDLDGRDPLAPLMVVGPPDCEAVRGLMAAAAEAGLVHYAVDGPFDAGYAAAFRRPAFAAVAGYSADQLASVGRDLRAKSIAVAVAAPEDDPGFAARHAASADLHYQSPADPAKVVRELVAEADRVVSTGFRIQPELEEKR